jgi:hypothetical protein
MPQKSPWHSIKENYHNNNTLCGPGGQIREKNKENGTGGKPLCKDCAKINKDGK